MFQDQVVDKAVEEEVNKVDSKVTTNVVTDLFVNQVGHLASLAASLGSLSPSTLIAWSTIFITTTTSFSTLTFTNTI